MIMIFGTLVLNDDISRIFFFFFEIFIFQAVMGVKGQKIAQNEKEQLHLSHAISQEQYSIWSWFLVHLCKMMISPGAFFHFFKILIFWVVRRVKGQKNSPKWQKTLSFALYISGTIHHMILIYGTHV